MILNEKWWLEIINIPKVKIKDISINYNGEKIANVQNLKVKVTREIEKIESFLEKEPISLLQGNEKYLISVLKIYLNKELFTDYKDFYNMSDFSLVVSYPGKNITCGCGCRLQAKARLINAKCVLNKWWLF